MTHQPTGKQRTQCAEAKVQDGVRRTGAVVWRIVRWIYRSIMALLTAGLVILFLVAAFSDHVSPTLFLYVSYLGILFPVFLVAALVWTVLLFVLRHWVLGGLMAAALLVAHEPMWRYCPIHFGSRTAVHAVTIPGYGSASGGVDTLRVLTYNTCAMGQTRLSKLEEPIPVLDVIRRSGADIVCLQEYAFTLSAGGHTEQRMRRALGGTYPYYHYLHYHNRKAMGIAVFSRFPIRKNERIDPSRDRYFASMYYEIELPDGRRLALVNNHLQSNAIAMADRRLADDMVEHFVADSLARVRDGMLRQLGRGFKARAGQAEQIARFLESRHADGTIPLLVCGDFNDTPISYCYQTIRGALGDTWEDAGLGPGITYNRRPFWFRIDHILHSPALRPLDVRVLTDVGDSDHYPVLATFQLLPASAADD